MRNCTILVTILLLLTPANAVTTDTLGNSLLWSPHFRHKDSSLDSQRGLTPAAIAGIAVGTFLVALTLGCVVIWFCLRRMVRSLGNELMQRQNANLQYP